MSIEEGKPYSLLSVNLLYLFMGIVFIFLGSLLQHWNFTAGILATEYGMLVLPATLFMLAKRRSIIRAFRFKMPNLTELALVLIAGICFVPSVAFLNSLVNVWLVYGFRVTLPQIPIGSSRLAPLITFLIAAATPGFCEEYFFRGMILSEYERRMTAFQAAVTTAVMFGLFHYNMMNFFGPMALGLIFAWILQVTNNFWNAMMGHMINNSLAVIMLYATSKISPEANMKAVEALGSNWPIVAALTLLGLAMISVPSAFTGMTILKHIRKRHPKQGDIIDIQGRRFTVETVKEGGLTISDSEGTAIETTWQKVFENKGAKYAHGHWTFNATPGVFRMKEWWPIGISVVMYFVVNALNLSMLIPQ